MPPAAQPVRRLKNLSRILPIIPESLAGEFELEREYVEEPEIPIDEVRELIRPYQVTLERAHEGLSTFELGPPEVLGWGEIQPEIIGSRTLSRLFEYQARVAVDDDRMDDAVQALLDVVRLGANLSYGGDSTCALVGGACLTGTLDDIYGVIDRLQPRHLDVILKDLDDLRDYYESPEAYVTWDPYYYAHLDVLSRIEYYWDFKLGMRKRFVRAMKRYHARFDLLRLEMAIRLYRLWNGRWPGSLDVLLPDALSRLPADPFSGQGFIYRLAGDSYVFYGVGPDGNDDGGLRATRRELRLGKRGDQFFDAEWY